MGGFRLHFQYSVSFVNSGRLRCSAFKDRGHMLEWRVELPVDGFQGSAFAYLAADVETETWKEVRNRKYE